MSLWKKFVLVFTAQTLKRVFIFAASTWGLIYGIQSNDKTLLFFGIGLAIVGYIWITLAFLETFLLTDYCIVESPPTSKVEEILQDVQCLERITKLRNSISTDSAEELYFDELKSNLINLKASLK